MSPGDCAGVRAGIYTAAFALAAGGVLRPEHMGPIAGGTKRAGTATGSNTAVSPNGGVRLRGWSRRASSRQ